MTRYFISPYTDGPSITFNVIDRRTQEWVRRFSTVHAAQEWINDHSTKDYLAEYYDLYDD